MAINLIPKSPRHTNGSAFALSAQGRYEEAEESFLKGEALDPNHHVLLMNMTSLYGRIGRVEDAELYVKKRDRHKS